MSKPLFHGRQAAYTWAKDTLNHRVAGGVSHDVWRQAKDAIMGDDLFTSLDVINVVVYFCGKRGWRGRLGVVAERKTK